MLRISRTDRPATQRVVGITSVPVSEKIIMDNPNKPNRSLKVIVVYPPAANPFQDGDASRDETVGVFKKRALLAFGLTEGPQPDGSVATYTLHHGKHELTNPNQTLGAIAGDKPVLQLKLAQQVTQGNGR